jgi:preprotein translocase subunit SecF
MNIPFLKYSKIYFIFSGILVLASLVSLLIFGLNLGIDFTGGSILEANFLQERPANQEIREKLAELDFLEEVLVQPAGKTGVILRMKDLSEKQHQEVLRKLGELGQLEEGRFESIGPVIGKELKEKTRILIVVALAAIVLYVTFAFRGVSRPVASWQYGLSALIALFHDVLIPVGVFSVLGKFYGIQVTIPVVAALLTVLGYSVNDTVVVFDRIREHLLMRKDMTFEETVNQSLNQTIVRSINISLTTLLVVGAIFFLGGETLKYFALALIVGIGVGTYSSLFLASPILVSWLAWQERRRNRG